MPFFDTIVAPITGQPPAAVAIVRVSGPQSWDVADKVFNNWPSIVKPRFAYYGTFVHGDDGLAIPFKEGASYTGERSVEFNIHGSAASLSNLIERCIRAGARIARPGEFTERAFLNGRLDLTQAEGIRDSIESVTELQLRQAALHREGHLTEQIRSIAGDLQAQLAAVEASVDFSEEIGEYDRQQGLERLRSALDRVDRLVSTAPYGHRIRHGIRIALLGKPNAGKSSLLNALLGRDRSIVTAVPGTTRDYIEEVAELSGVKCILIDTAGLRDTEDVVEGEGVLRARRIAESADAVWFLHDLEKPWTEGEQQELDGLTVPVVLIGTKSDLPHVRLSSSTHDVIELSSTNRAGFEQLLNWVANFVNADRAAKEPFVASRHVPLLDRARNALETVIATFENDLPDDLASVGLRDAIQALDEVTGEAASEDMISKIFADFCIGK